ncbi:hypothetical protein NLX65_03810 [Candidatus Cardinium sp. TP]|nr:hypothetical protein [Candidatus Cardinium sp. TP]
MDSSLIKAHQDASGASKKTIDEFPDEWLGRSRGGLTSKIHCLSDEFGNAVELMLTGGQVHDSQCAEALLSLLDQIERKCVILTNIIIKIAI